MIDTTKNNLYFIALDTLEQLKIQFIPDELSISNRSNISDVVIIGQNTPEYHYISGGASKISFGVDFYGDDVKRKVNWLRSLQLYDGDIRTPQKVKLIWGDLFKENEWVVLSVNAKYSLFSGKDLQPTRASVELILGLDSDNLKWEDL